MSDPNPTKNPLDWFLRACLVLLFGTVALSLAVDLLTRIWPWLLGGAMIIATAWAAVAWWRSRSRPW